MKKSFLFIAILGILVATNAAFAHTGYEDPSGDPATTVIDWTDDAITSISYTEHEYTNGNTTVFKGWWWVSIKNSTTKAWSGMAITPGTNDLVAIAKGNGLEDEFGNVGDSVVCSKAGSSFAYNTYIRDITYTSNGATAELYKSVYCTFGTYVNPGQSVLFKVYTDNSYYGTPAGEYQLTLTPTAVPEPGSLLALSAGLVGVAGFVRRRRS